MRRKKWNSLFLLLTVRRQQAQLRQLQPPPESPLPLPLQQPPPLRWKVERFPSPLPQRLLLPAAAVQNPGQQQQLLSQPAVSPQPLEQESLQLHSQRPLPLPSPGPPLPSQPPPQPRRSVAVRSEPREIPGSPEHV